MPTREELLAEIAALKEQANAAQEQLDALDKEAPAENEETKAAKIKQIIKDKKLNIEYAGEGMLIKSKTVAANLRSSVAAEENIDKAAPSKRKRSLKDYRPTAEELAAINLLANVDVDESDVYVFESMAADTNVDMDFEHFDVEALNDGAKLCPDHPIQLDHERSIKATVGKLMSGRVANKKLYQKFYIPDIPENQALLKNIALGVYNKVSVSFGCEVKDYKCDLCKQPIVSEACPHMPGMMDDKGALCTITIGRMARFHEKSLVWLPCQPKAGIRRNDVPSSDSKAAKPEANPFIPTITVPGSAITNLQVKDGEVISIEYHFKCDGEQSPTPSDQTSAPSDLDTIPNDKSQQGDSSVSDTPNKPQEAPAEAVTEANTEATAAEGAAQEAPAAQEENKPAETPAAETQPAVAAEQGGEAEETKALNSLKEEVAELRKSQTEIVSQLASIAEVVKASAEAVNELKSAKPTSAEEVVQEILAALPNEEDTQAKSAPVNVHWTQLMRAKLNKEESNQG